MTRAAKPTGRAAPTTLYQRARDRAREEFDARMKELDRIAGQFGMLEKFLPAVVAAGLEIHPADVRADYPRGLCIRSWSAFDNTRGARLWRALVAAGMRVDKRSEPCGPNGDYTTALRHGHLRVLIGVDGRGEAVVAAKEAQAAAAAPAPQEAAPCQ